MEPSSSLPIRATPTPYLTPALLLWTRPGRVSNTTHRIPAGSRFIGRIHSSRAGVRVPHYEPELSPVRSRLPVSGRGRCFGPGNQTELLVAGVVLGVWMVYSQQQVVHLALGYVGVLGGAAATVGSLVSALRNRGSRPGT